MALSKRFPLKGAPKLCIHNKVLSVWRRKLAGVCFALIKRGASMKEKGIWEIKEKASGKVDRVLCLGGEKRFTEDLDMNIIGFTVRLTWHRSTPTHPGYNLCVF